MKKPKISVVIPTYNRGKLIKKSLRTVLNQTIKNIEVIIVDDGSKDKTELIINRLRHDDERIRYIKFKKNRGANAARNAGIRASRAKLIAFQDSDDLWDKKKLEIQLQIFAKHPRIGVVYTAFWRYLNGEKTLEPSMINHPMSGSIHKSFLWGNLATTSSCMVKKEVFRRVGFFDENLPRYQDWEMWLRASKKYDFRFINKPLVKLYVQKDSISKNRDKLIFAVEYIIKKYKKDFNKNRKILAHHYIKLAETFDFRKKEEFKKGSDYLYRAFKIWPFLPIKQLLKIVASSISFNFYNKIISIK